MVNKIYQHQERILKEDKLKCGLFLGTGTGKTLTALKLAQAPILVICPKQQRDDQTWERNAEKFDLVQEMKVISKEDLRRDWDYLPAFKTVIIDECHNNFGVSPEMRQRKGKQIPKTSQIFEATYNYLQKHPPKRLYLCSATPVSKPMNLWAIATLFGHRWNFLEFREKYYRCIRIGMRQIWLPREDEATRSKLAELVKKFGYTGSLNDFFDVPEQTHKEVIIELTTDQKKALRELHATEADPLVRRARQRTIENGVLYGKKVIEVGDKIDEMVSETTIYPSAKIDYILDRALEFPKLLIFANYTAQINEIARTLTLEGYNVVTLTGKTKDRSTIIQDAENSKACVVIAQASISSGYELPSFPCVVFASKSWRAVDLDQAYGRVLRANKLKKNLYIHLIVKGGPDEACHDAVMSGKDFYEMVNFIP